MTLYTNCQVKNSLHQGLLYMQLKSLRAIHTELCSRLREMLASG